MTNENPRTDRKLELSPAQVAGSALAAVSGAFFASWAGTAGTLIGAALGSVIATVGAATYTWSLRRTRDAVRRPPPRSATDRHGQLPRVVAGPAAPRTAGARRQPLEDGQRPGAGRGARRTEPRGRHAGASCAAVPGARSRSPPRA